jgi:hypothetical protein
LKEGVIINNIELVGKTHYILGRQPDIVDLQLDHPSISRKHAALQYRKFNITIYLSIYLILLLLFILSVYLSNITIIIYYICLSI